MRLVVDANALFAVLVRDLKSAEIILNAMLELHAPSHLLDEFAKHREELLEKTRRSEQDFFETMELLKRRIEFHDWEATIPFAEKAREISPDESDWPYFALALKLGAGLWSNDKKLKKQGQIKVWTTGELIDLLKTQ